MAFTFRRCYEPQIEERMRGFWQTLSEKDKRRFSALEAARLGRGGARGQHQRRPYPGGRTPPAAVAAAVSMPQRVAAAAAQAR
jgi:hypothetical protein